MLLGITAVFLFNTVDTVFVGQLGVKPLAAMSYTFPVSFVVTGVSIGLGVGTVAVISQAIGEGDSARVIRLATDSLILAFLVVGAIGMLGIFTMAPVFRALGADSGSLRLIRDYMTIWYAGVPLLAIPMSGNSTLRATGDAKIPSLIMIVAGLVNVVLDPLLIFGLGPFPRLELRGAAIATVVSWAVACLMGLWMLYKRERLLSLDWPSMSQLSRSFSAVLLVGIPAGIVQLLLPVSAAAFTRILSGFGQSAVAAFGVCTRIESLAMVGVMAMASALGPFAGQNFGSRRITRISLALRFGFKSCLVWGAAMAVVLALLGRPLAALFNDHASVVALVTAYLLVVPISYACAGISLNVMALFNATSRPLISALLIGIRLFVLAIPGAYLASKWWGAVGVFGAISAANVLSCLVSMWASRRFVVALKARQGK